MAHKLRGKVAIVTASTNGIGYEIAKRFAERGANVLISSRKAQNVESALKRLKEENNLTNVSGVVCHAGRKDDRQKLVEKVINEHGKLDIVVSNAGVNPYIGWIMNTKEEVWDKVYETNIKSAFFLAKETLPHLTKTKGNMLFVSSFVGFQPEVGMGAYSVSKAALLGLIVALAKEVAPVRVNGIAPRLIDTDFTSGILLQPEIAKEYNFHEYVANTALLKRLGRAEECAGAAEFLCSDDGAYVTGETVKITGGLHPTL